MKDRVFSKNVTKLENCETLVAICIEEKNRKREQKKNLKIETR